MLKGKLKESEVNMDQLSLEMIRLKSELETKNEDSTGVMQALSEEEKKF